MKVARGSQEGELSVVLPCSQWAGGVHAALGTYHFVCGQALGSGGKLHSWLAATQEPWAGEPPRGCVE